MSSFCTAKATHIFFSKKFQHICVSLDVNLNESLTNDVVSFEQLGPVDSTTAKMFFMNSDHSRLQGYTGLFRPSLFTCTVYNSQVYPRRAKAQSRLQGHAGWSDHLFSPVEPIAGKRVFPWTAKAQNRLQGHAGRSRSSLLTVHSTAVKILSMNSDSPEQITRSCRLMKNFTIHQ